jgi:cysteine-rich repeat protein
VVRLGYAVLALGGLTLSTAACLEVPGMLCDDGRVCPSGMVCAPHGCALPQQLEACAGREPGEPCTYAGIQGTCIDGLCISSGCGNGVVDPGEACDDGRRCEDGTPCQGTCGDGSNCQPRGGFDCSRDCLKIEVCGDGFRDEGEACDDGNDNPADGCDQCRLTEWVAEAIVGGGKLATGFSRVGPKRLALDASGNLFIADTTNFRIVRVQAPMGVVTTAAGAGTDGYSGDGGPATSAELSSLGGVAVDGLGNLFIADTGNQRIRRVDAATGTISTVAGTGTIGFSGDGGPATSADLDQPHDIAVDGLGNLFIADFGNNRVRRVDAASGTISTVAGNGTRGFAGDGEPATDAQLNLPRGVTVDFLGNLLIADTSNQRVRQVDASTGIINTVAGVGTVGFSGDGGPAHEAQFSHPCHASSDRLGNIFIADRGNSRIRRIDATAGLITTVAGEGTRGFAGDGGPAVEAHLNFPEGAAIDGAGNVFIADTSNGRVRLVDASTGVITTVAGAEAFAIPLAATSERLPAPSGLAIDPTGNLVFSSGTQVLALDTDAGLLRVVSGTGMPGYLGDGGPATEASLFGPKGLAYDADGNLFVADPSSHRIRRIDAASGIITTVAGTGSWGFSGDGDPATSAQLQGPQDVAVDASGHLYIADASNHRVRRVDAASGVISTFAGNGDRGFSGDDSPAAEAQLDFPTGLAVDTGGNVYISDLGNLRIRRVDALTGIITTLVGTGEQGYTGDEGPAADARLGRPLGLSMDATSNLLIADAMNDSVRRVDLASGIITTLAGDGIPGFSGDADLASAARLEFPHDMATDEAGNIYIADFGMVPAFGDGGKGRIRQVGAATGVIMTVAGRIDPDGMGVAVSGQLADPRGLALTPTSSMAAGGSTGTVQVFRTDEGLLEAAIGRYPQDAPTADLARFRDWSFGTVGGIAYDASAGLIYLTESTANRIHVVTIVDPDDKHTWTIATLANEDGTSGFTNGAASTARFRNPTGLYLDVQAQTLYVADTGNHVLRAIDLSGGPGTASVTTVAGTPETLGFFGDYGPAASALLFQPQAVTRCDNGDIFLADTGNHRVRRIEPDGTITTVLGDGTAASSGEGAPAVTFPVNAPLGLACDPFGNLLVTSTTAVRLVAANDDGMVDGLGPAITIYGAAPRDTFPASVTRCLTGLAIVDATTVQVTDSCTGILIELRREPAP